MSIGQIQLIYAALPFRKEPIHNLVGDRESADTCARHANVECICAISNLCFGWVLSLYANTNINYCTPIATAAPWGFFQLEHGWGHIAIGSHRQRGIPGLGRGHIAISSWLCSWPGHGQRRAAISSRRHCIAVEYCMAVGAGISPPIVFGARWHMVIMNLILYQKKFEHTFANRKRIGHVCQRLRICTCLFVVEFAVLL